MIEALLVLVAGALWFLHPWGKVLPDGSIQVYDNWDGPFW